MTIWISSDHHFGHTNIIEFCNRPWETAKEMNESLIKNWNEKIGPEDEVYILGDMMMGNSAYWESTLNKLKGKLHLIVGNHDRKFIKQSYVQERMIWIKDYYELRVEDKDGHNKKSQLIILSHYAMLAWNGSYRNSFMLYGHSHTRLDHMNTNVRRLDVGVDGHNYYPWSYQEIKEHMNAKTIVVDKGM